jgi:hypothetical protein
VRPATLVRVRAERELPQSKVVLERWRWRLRREDVRESRLRRSSVKARDLLSVFE